MSGGELWLPHDSRPAFAWRAGRGPVHAGWEAGAGEATGSDLRAEYRFFHPAETWEMSEISPYTKQGLWADFSSGEKLRAARSFIGELAPVTLPALALPPAREVVSRPEWDRFCARIDEALRQGALKKAVPARPCFHPLEKSARARLAAELPARLFSRPADGSYRFFLSRGESIFFGASPELLFRREGGKIFVPAIAGTRAHGPGRASLAEAGTELLASAKDRAEQALVTEGIVASLRALGLHPTHPAGPTLLEARNLVHLFTPIEAKDPGAGALPAEKLIAALHPTPAVGGLPKRAAGDFLAAYEPWERGLFASPLLFSAGAAQICVVAIRSGLLNSEGLYLFAGAGYVEGSHAAGEWEETARKFESLRGLLQEGS